MILRGARAWCPDRWLISWAINCRRVAFLMVRLQRAGDKIIHIPGGYLGHRQQGPRAAAAGPVWWDPDDEGLATLVAYQPKGAASLAASYTNRANPGTFDAIATLSLPTWDAVNGWTFDGLTQYLDSGLAGANTYSMIVRYSGTIPSTSAVAGLTIGIQVRLNIYPKYTNNNTYLRAGGSSTTVAPAGFATGNFAVTPAQGYWNGAIFGAALGDAYVGATAALIALGAHRTILGAAPAPGNYWPGSIQALAVYNATLTGAQVAAVYAAMAAL